MIHSAPPPRGMTVRARSCRLARVRAVASTRCAVARAVAASHGLTIEREHLSLPELRVRDGGYFARMLRG